MKLIKIAVGPASDRWRSYLREIADELAISIEIHLLGPDEEDTLSVVLPRATPKKSIAAAMSTLRENKKSDIGVGINVDYHRNKDDLFEVFCCVSIVDKEGFVQTVTSRRVILPDFYQKTLKKYGTLGDYILGKKGNLDKRDASRIREMITIRKPLVITALRGALTNYLQSIWTQI